MIALDHKQKIGLIALTYASLMIKKDLGERKREIEGREKAGKKLERRNFKGSKSKRYSDLLSLISENP